MNEKDQPQGADILSSFPFLRDAGLSDDLKKFLVEKSIGARDAVWTRQMEEKKWRWSTPLAVALTGVITIGANFLFDYLKANQSQSIQEKTGDRDAIRRAEATEREFEYRIVERELSDNNKSEGDRARVLLFLVRAGVLNGLNSDELKSMAQASLDKLKKEGEEPDSIGIPSLGASTGPVSDNFQGLSRSAAKLSVGNAAIERFKDLSDLVTSLPPESTMTSHVLPITKDPTSARVTEEQKNVSLRAFLYAASRQASNDYHLVIGRAPGTSSNIYMTAIVSGLPAPNAPSFSTLKSVRDTFKGFLAPTCLDRGTCTTIHLFHWS